MDRTINTKQLRATLPDIVRRVRLGERFTVLYRSQPAFRVVPLVEPHALHRAALRNDPLYGAPAVGRSADGRSSRDHDLVLYGRSRR